MPWRLFAINNWWEGPLSAMLRLALLPAPSGEMWLAAAESLSSPARFSRFVRPPDPKQFWTEDRFEVSGGVHNIGAMAEHHGALYVGEHRGSESRLMVFRDGRLIRSSRTGVVVGMWSRGNRLIVLQPEGLSYF
jgi:hypothetical protein